MLRIARDSIFERGYGRVAMMSVLEFRHLANRYFDWLESVDICVPPELADYYPHPSLTEEFVAYVAVPTKLFTREEFSKIERLLNGDVRLEIERDYVRYLRRVLSARFANLLNSKLHKELNLISIGGNCVPRLLFSKWGLRKTRPLGARSLPFDLLWCEPSGIFKILASNFSGMIDPDRLSIATKKDVREIWKWFVGNTPIVVNNSYDVCYNHEAGPYWLDNNCKKLIDRYETRIGRFQDLIKNGLPTIALMNHQRPFTDESYNRLLSAAKALADAATASVHVVCVVSAGQSSDYTNNKTINIDEGLRLTIAFNAQPPEPYLFYMPTSYGSAAGLEWESEFLYVLKTAISKEIDTEISLGLDL